MGKDDKPLFHFPARPLPHLSCVPAPKLVHRSVDRKNSAAPSHVAPAGCRPLHIEEDVGFVESNLTLLREMRAGAHKPEAGARHLQGMQGSGSARDAADAS